MSATRTDIVELKRMVRAWDRGKVDVSDVLEFIEEIADDVARIHEVDIYRVDVSGRKPIFVGVAYKGGEIDVIGVLEDPEDVTDVFELFAMEDDGEGSYGRKLAREFLGHWFEEYLDYWEKTYGRRRK